MEPAAQNRTILVIEDDPVLLAGAADLFEAAGMTVVGFANGDRALDYLRTDGARVAAVFTDVKILGETDGLDLAGQVAETCPHIAVVVTSGEIPESPAHLHPRVRYLRKPWQPFDVLNAVIDAKSQD